MDVMSDGASSMAPGTTNSTPSDKNQPALVLGGGGARAAYQAGALCYVGEAFPEAELPLMTGVSAGSINAAQLAADPAPLPKRTDGLTSYWDDLTMDDVFTPRSLWTLGRSLFGGSPSAKQTFLDTSPLRQYLDQCLSTDGEGHLTGVADNLDEGSTGRPRDFHLQLRDPPDRNLAPGLFVEGLGAPQSGGAARGVDPRSRHGLDGPPGGLPGGVARRCLVRGRRASHA